MFFFNFSARFWRNINWCQSTRRKIPGMRKKFQVRDRPLKSRTWKFQVYEWRHEIRVQKSRDLQKKRYRKSSKSMVFCKVKLTFLICCNFFVFWSYELRFGEKNVLILIRSFPGSFCFLGSLGIPSPEGSDKKYTKSVLTKNTQNQDLHYWK